MDLKKLAQLAKAKGKPKKGVTPMGGKGIHIGKKRVREEAPNISPMKKGKKVADAKKKWPMPSTNDKNKGTTAKAPLKSKSTLGRTVTQDVPTFTTPGKGTSVNQGVVLGLEAFALDNPAMAEKLLQGIVLPADKEKASRLDLNMVTTQFLHSLI